MMLNKIEPVVENIERHEKERGTSKRLNVIAKEIQSKFTKLEKEYDETMG